VYSVEYDWYPVYRVSDGEAPNKSNELFALAGTTPDVHIRQWREYPARESKYGPHIEIYKSIYPRHEIILTMRYLFQVSHHPTRQLKPLFRVF
jgi:hypothetical protein